MPCTHWRSYHFHSNTRTTMSRAEKPKSRFRSNALLVITVCLVIVVLGWIFGPSGSVHGIEFSPDRFAHRSFSYYQWCGLQISPMQTREWHSKVDEYLHANGFVPRTEELTPRWDFVKGSAPFVRGWHGDAKVMCQAIGCYSGSDEWVVWSQNNPELANVVWPQVMSWARNGQYEEIACLFKFVDLDKAKTPEDVKQRIEQAGIEALK